MSGWRWPRWRCRRRGRPRALPLRVGASRSSHSGAPSSRFHCAWGFGRGAPRRRSRSSDSSQMRSSASRWLTWWAPRRATLPHPAALRGSGGRSSRMGRSARGPPSLPTSREADVRRGAPVRGGPDRAAPDRGSPVLGVDDLGELERPGPGFEPSARVPADPGRPVRPALFPVGRCGDAPPLRAVPRVPAELPELPELVLARLGAPLRVPLPLAGRRAPPPRTSCAAGAARRRPPRTASAPLPTSAGPGWTCRPTRPRRGGAAIRLGGVLGHRVILGVRVAVTRVAAGADGQRAVRRARHPAAAGCRAAVRQRRRARPPPHPSAT